jgi:ribonuclease P protein component
LAKFKKKQKLLRRAEFTLTMDRGSKVVTPCVVLLGRVSDSGRARVGFIVSKKVGGAVTRNLVKRRLREAYRTMELPGVALDVVVIARVGADSCPFEDLKRIFGEGLIQLVSKVSRRRPEGSAQAPGLLKPAVEVDDKKLG